MMMKKVLTIAVIAALGLTGCGSDSDDTSSTPIAPTPVEPAYENFEIAVEPNATFEGIVKVYLGRWYPCTTEHPEMCSDDMPADYAIPTTGALTGGTYGTAQSTDDVDVNKLYNVMTSDDSQYYMEIKADDIKAFSATSVRDDIFVAGHYSILDVMLYVSSIRDDFEVTLGEFNTERNTYDFTTSFDANGDGDFEDTTEGDYYKSDNWYGAFLLGGGDFQKAMGIPLHEAMYDRLDEFLVQPSMNIRFQPVSDAMKVRRQQMQTAEVDRFKANGGKVILPELLVNFGDGLGAQLIATNIEVKPYNLRPDIYQKDVITMADALMSAYESHGIGFKFSFWPTVSTNATVGSYAVSEIEGQHASGLYGWVLTSGESQAAADFYWGPEWPNYVEVMNGMGPFAGKCEMLRDTDGNLSAENAQECIDHWYAIFGGNNTHVMTDVSVMSNGKEYISFNWKDNMYELWEVTQKNTAEDGQYPIYDINEAIAPLAETHFGYGIADCGLCHSMDNIHLNGDSPVLPDNTEPYFCASCHGSNGAPVGHGETSRCFWCHSNDKLMANHGEASKLFKFEEVECYGETNLGTVLNGEMGSCADQVKLSLDINEGETHNQIHTSTDNGTTYGELDASKKLTTGNSDWRTSESFPDPYSCMTCHPNQ
ncbi:hypothetical protein [Shewanella youngdeokensis]|uniref:Cytochrome c7-like domain-containing protein n=1 Tax=Shewanella youngdeokensis TaxID=2999068 RepID=A0ABZ0K3Z4_9GAMM|nr:hypothetical protein RGE70_08575 [Shewanella sp. DAU334]